MKVPTLLRRTCFTLLSIAPLALPAQPTSAQPIPARQTLGAVRGFLVVRSEAGALLGSGEYSQQAHGDRVSSRLTLRFRDGSLDDETTVFTQRSTLQFVSDHHIQSGPFFATPIDMTLLVSGDLTLRTREKNGQPRIETNHIDLPPDIANGMVSQVLLNLPHNTPNVTLGMVAPTGKGRLIKLLVSPGGQGSFSIAGVRRKADIFRLHPELGGVAGFVAPLIGKQPDDVFVWIVPGDTPAIVREVAQLAEGGPTISLELAGTTFPHTPARH